MVNVSITIIDDNYNFVRETIPVIADTVTPKIKILSPSEGKTYSISLNSLHNADNISFNLIWTAEDYSGISKYEIYCYYHYGDNYPYNPSPPLGNLILTTNDTHANITIPAPPSNVITTYVYEITIYCYDTCGNANYDTVTIQLKILPPLCTTNQDSDNNVANISNNSPSQSWFTQWGGYVLSGGIFASGAYTFVRYRSKHTIKAQTPKKTKKSFNPKAKAKSHVICRHLPCLSLWLYSYLLFLFLFFQALTCFNQFSILLWR